jgi:ketosteroid isomerase-like protein
VPRDAITEADVERMQRGFTLYNEGDWDALREFIADDIVVERAGELPPLHGWDAFRQLLEPDAFEWQRMYPQDWTINCDKVVLRVRMHARGAASGLELDILGWQVWTVSDGVVVRIQAFTDEADARRAAGLGQNASP